MPIDPDQPADRVAYLISDARPVLTLTEPDLAAHLPPDTPTLIVRDLVDELRHDAVHRTAPPP